MLGSFSIHFTITGTRLKNVVYYTGVFHLRFVIGVPMYCE